MSNLFISIVVRRNMYSARPIQRVREKCLTLQQQQQKRKKILLPQGIGERRITIFVGNTITRLKQDMCPSNSIRLLPHVKSLFAAHGSRVQRTVRTFVTCSAQWDRLRN